VGFDKAQPFEIHHERTGDGTVKMRLSGEFDLAGCEEFEAALSAVHGNGLLRLVIDLAELTFIDSSGIRALLDSRRRAEESGVELVVSRPQNGQVRQVLELTGVDQMIIDPGR
jgi:anti-anti-sigma factor